jgi:hypothetical protein
MKKFSRKQLGKINTDRKEERQLDRDITSLLNRRPSGVSESEASVLFVDALSGVPGHDDLKGRVAELHQEQK